ncbi:MAG: type II toxin-antitoxin system VapC family toxin [Phycisphaerae bacterium]
MVRTGRKLRVYLETTIISYLAARPGRDLVTAAHQQVTADWWRECRVLFEVFVSGLVLEELRRGDPDAADRRKAIIDGVAVLGLGEPVGRLAHDLVEQKAIPQSAAADALHVAVAAVHQMDFLMTWNCTHINNAQMISRIRKICELSGFECPVICTPEELSGV